MVECLIVFRNNPRKVRVFSFYHNIIVGVANWFIQGLHEAEKTFSIKLLVSWELGKTILSIPQTSTFVRSLFHMVFLEHLLCLGHGELTPTLVFLPLT
jgi:uncharacterized protein (DUF2062 family)